MTHHLIKWFWWYLSTCEFHDYLIRFKSHRADTNFQQEKKTHKWKQEAHGPRFAHLSDIATADMQMLCNIFPILSSQLMKISSFEQFLVLKKNIWAWQSMEHDHLNKLSITFQQKDQCEIWWKLAKWFLKNRDFIHVYSTVAGKYYKYKPDDGHLRFPIRTILTTVDLQVTSILSI